MSTNQSRDDRGAVFSPIQAEFVTQFFDRAAGLATVFLIIKLGWQHASVFLVEPQPMLMAVLCFFHVMVYWINFHHFLKFSRREFSITQTWTVIGMAQ